MLIMIIIHIFMNVHRREMIRCWIIFTIEVLLVCSIVFDHRKLNVCSLMYLDVSASELYSTLLDNPDFASQIHSRFFAFWPPRDVDLLQWLTHWIKQSMFSSSILEIVSSCFSSRFKMLYLLP